MNALDLRSRLLFFFLYATIVAAFGLVLFFVLDSKYATVAIAVSCMLLLLVGLQIAVFAGTSDNKVRLRLASASIVLLFGALEVRSKVALLIAKPLLEWASSRLNFNLPKHLFDESGPLDYGLAVTIVLAWLAICALILRNVGRSPMGRPPDASLSELLAKPTTNERLQALKGSLQHKLNGVNAQTRWSTANYVPLEAEVQILQGRTARRKVVDLLKAIRVNPRTGLFVVLGEPGTGKSVALRTLTSELLERSRPKDRIPIYINLKEWRTDTIWTPDNKPTVNDFHKFVTQNVLQDLDLPSQSFLKEHFDVLLEKGFFFFILDSFDEIPAVLDHDEDSWIISELSNCISLYVLHSRGIIASRLFRQPKLNHRDRTVLEIQPFSDDRIVRAVKLTTSEPDRLIRIIVNERLDLGVIARNPFLLHLIIFHFNEVKSAPESQAAMFQTFIDANVDSAKATLGIHDQSRDEIYRTCEDISAAMFENQHGGLEIADFELREKLDLPNLDFVLRFLVSARIGRIGQVSGAFSFSHRRFNEYFLVRRLSSKRLLIPFDAIQTDSRWRDALVLYVEIAKANDARALAAHAWKYAKGLGSINLGSNRSEFITARNAFRFLIEGFRNRSATIKPYRKELSRMIASKLRYSAEDYIEIKTVLEGLGLLDVRRATEMIQAAMKSYPGWISEQAVSAARYLPTIDEKLADSIYLHCVRRGGLQGLLEAKRQVSILSVSDAFKKVTTNLKWYIADSLKAWLFAGVFGFLILTGNYPGFHLPILLGGILATLAILSLLIVLVFKGRDTPLELRWVPTIYAVAFLVAQVGLREPVSLPALLPQAILCLVIIPITPRFWSVAKNTVAAFTRRVLLRERTIPTPAQFWSQTKGSIPYVFIGPVAIVLLGFLANLIPKWLIEKIAFVLLVLGAAVAAVLVVIALFLIGRLVYRQCVERFALTRMIEAFRPDRLDIAKNFESLSTGWARLAYVRRLETLSINHLDDLRRDDNIWPNGTRPQTNDAASMKLAQLDARWLDLD